MSAILAHIPLKQLTSDLHRVTEPVLQQRVIKRNQKESTISRYQDVQKRPDEIPRSANPAVYFIQEVGLR